MQIALLTGRDFNDRDTQTSPHVAVVNEAFARKYLGGAHPIGKTFRSVAEPGYRPTDYEFVGVVRKTKNPGFPEETPPEGFAPLSHFPVFARRVSFFPPLSPPP